MSICFKLNERFWGCLKNNATIPLLKVTSERDARLVAAMDGILSVRIYLHSRGAPSSTDRPVGQVMILIQYGIF